MNNYNIIKIDTLNKSEIIQILNVWERSVRATHNFLTEENIISIKPFVESGLHQMTNLICAMDSHNNIYAFMGVYEDKIEMLFVDSNLIGNGIGKNLIQYAINNLSIKYVDVNEQNPKAVGFYMHLGFEVFDRSETDNEGNPFPILHMKL